MNTNTIFADAIEEIKFDEALKNASSTALYQRWISSNGLGQLAKSGVRVWEEATGHNLPHNLIWSQMSGSVGDFGPYGRKVSEKEADEAIEHYARLGGWLREAANFKALRKVIERGQSGNGINSSRTLFDLEAFFMLYKSPGAADFALRKAKSQALTILSAFNTSRKPSWAVLAIALLKTKGNCRKAAFIAVANALYGVRYLSYRQSVKLLTDGRTARFDEKISSKGVEYLYDTDSCKEFGKVKTYFARYTDNSGCLCFTVLAIQGEKIFLECELEGYNSTNNPVDSAYEQVAHKAEIFWQERGVIEEAIYRGQQHESVEVKVVDCLPSRYDRHWNDYGGYNLNMAMHDAGISSIYGKTAVMQTPENGTYLINYFEKKSHRGNTRSFYIKEVFITKDADHQVVANKINEAFARLHGGEEYLRKVS
jgi:hypothetical protein